MIFIGGLWLIIGVALLVQGLRKQKEEDDLDIMRSPLLVLAWPIMFLAVGPMIALPVFALVALAAWGFNSLGEIFGAPLIGEAVGLFVVLMCMTALSVYFRRGAHARCED